MFLLFLTREHPASVIAPLNHTCYKWRGIECCWWRVGWQAVSSALRTPPSAQPSEGRKLACFILPSTIDSSSPLCTSATARTELPDSLKFMRSLWATTRHTWRAARTLTFIYDYSHFHMVRVMLLSVSMQETCNSLFLRNLIACNYVAHFVRVKDHYHDKKKKKSSGQPAAHLVFFVALTISQPLIGTDLDPSTLETNSKLHNWQPASLGVWWNKCILICAETWLPKADLQPNSTSELCGGICFFFLLLLSFSFLSLPDRLIFLLSVGRVLMVVSLHSTTLQSTLSWGSVQELSRSLLSVSLTGLYCAKSWKLINSVCLTSQPFVSGVSLCAAGMLPIFSEHHTSTGALCIHKMCKSLDCHRLSENSFISAFCVLCSPQRSLKMEWTRESQYT